MKSRYSVIALIVLTCVTSVSLGQGRRGGRGGPGGPGPGISPLMLLSIPAVQEELELIDQQKQELRTIAESMRPQRPPRRDRRPEDGAERDRQDRRADREAMREEAQKRMAKAQEAVNEVLLDNQQARLQQIFVQVAGTQALDHKEIADKLNITDQQKEEIQRVRNDARREMRGLFADGPREGIREKMQEFRTKIDNQVLAQLSEEQQQQFEQLKGDPIEIPRDELFSRRGRGRGGFGPAGRDREARRGNRPNRPQRPAE